MSEKKKSKKPLVITLIIILLLAGGGAGIFCYFYFKTVDVNLNDYVSVSFSGYDTIGTAEVTYDFDKLKADLGKEDDANMAKVAENSGARLDRTDNLKNGDTLNLTFFYSNQIAYDSRITFTCTDTTVTVEGLQEPEELDPFANLKFTYKGTGPYAEAKMKNKTKNETLKQLKLSYSPSKNLSTGDKITVKVNGYNEKDFINNYHAKLTATETEVEVPRMDQYVTRINQLSEDDLKEVTDITTRLGVNQYFRSNTVKPWVKVKGIKRIGTYLLTKKDMNAALGSYKNRYYDVYKMTVQSKKKKGQTGYFKKQTIYQPVELVDLFFYKDGGIRDFLNKRMGVSQYPIRGTTGINYNGNSSMLGFTSLKKMKKELVTCVKKEYTCEKEGDLE